MRQSIWWMGVVCMAVLAGSMSSAEAVILINEVLADPAGDANRDGEIHSTRDEFVELVNTDALVLSLARWSLSDATQVRHFFSDTASIPAYSFFVVFGGGAPQGFANVAIASRGSLGLNNGGDTVTLQDASAHPIDTFTYGAEGGVDVSLTRSPDATGPFVQHSRVSGATFSPGTTTKGLTTLPHLRQEPPQEDPALPEPASWSFLGLGLFSLPLIRRHLSPV